MALCVVVEPRTLRECRIALGQSQAAFAALLDVSPESYRTWDTGRRATPSQVMARAQALATHRDDHALLPLPVLALLIGVHVKTLRAAARDGRLPVTYDTRTTFRRLRARATPAAARVFRRTYYGRTVRCRSSRAIDLGVRARGLRRADSCSASRTWVEPGAIGHAGGRGAEGRRLPMGGAQTHAVAPVLATPHRALHDSGQPLGNRIVVSQVQRAALIGAVNNAVGYQWEARRRVPFPSVRGRIAERERISKVPAASWASAAAQPSISHEAPGATRWPVRSRC